jgi:hypothetical protein
LVCPERMSARHHRADNQACPEGARPPTRPGRCPFTEPRRAGGRLPMDRSGRGEYRAASVPASGEHSPDVAARRMTGSASHGASASRTVFPLDMHHRTEGSFVATPSTRMSKGRGGAYLSAEGGASRSRVDHHGRRIDVDEKLDVTASGIRRSQRPPGQGRASLRGTIGRGSGKFARRSRFLSDPRVVEVLRWWARRPPMW